MPDVIEQPKKSVNIFDDSADVDDYDFYFNGVKLTVTVQDGE